MNTATTRAARTAMIYASQMRHLGFRITACTATNGVPWVKSAPTSAVDPEVRAAIQTGAWRCPAIVEWSVK